MKLLLLRGQVPTDRPKGEIKYRTMDECDDIYTLMADKIAEEVCVAYWGGKRKFSPRPGMTDVWVPDYHSLKLPWTPDVIWARGGFSEYLPVLKKYSGALKVYYGAGRRFIPDTSTGRHIDLVLVDCQSQARKVGMVYANKSVRTFFKPVSQMFGYECVKSKYDLCYVAAIPEDNRKRCKWVYETCPRNMRVLQLGYKPLKMKVPSNFKVKRVERQKMSHYLNQCRVLIAPYTKHDSGPRIIPEALACGLPVVTMKDTLHNEIYPTRRVEKNKFWGYVKEAVKDVKKPYHVTVESAAGHLREMFEESFV
jgi:hypothetical protein